MATINSYIENRYRKPSDEWFSNARRLFGEYNDLFNRAMYSYCYMNLDVTEYPVFIAWLVNAVADKNAFAIIINEYKEHTQLEENNFIQRRKLSLSGGAKISDYTLSGIFTPVNFLIEGNIIFKENLFPIDNLKCKCKNIDLSLNNLCSLYE